MLKRIEKLKFMGPSYTNTHTIYIYAYSHGSHCILLLNSIIYRKRHLVLSVLLLLLLLWFDCWRLRFLHIN